MYARKELEDDDALLRHWLVAMVDYRASGADPASAYQIGRQPPPPLRYERRPPYRVRGMPGWTDTGELGGGRYVWVAGRWDRPPYAGAYWSHPHYDHYPDGWHYHEGHWDRDDHGDHHDDHHDDQTAARDRSN